MSLPAPPAGAVASAPSFDCSKAKRADEIAICGDPRLGELDRLIAGADDALRSSRGRESADAISIRFWYQRGACQSDAPCVGKVQIEELEAFQAAGVSLDLPFWARPAPTYQPTPIHVPTPTYTPTPVNTPPPSPVVPAPTPVAAAGCDGSKRVAMVIGEGAYRGSAALANPANDADDIARLLREKLCFQTILVKDADLETLSAGVGELAQAAEGADVALFYFSGHGMQFQQVNYLLPTDARLANEYDLVHRSISAQDIVTLLAARAKVVLVFLDACRSDPIEDDFRRRMAGQHREIAPTRGLAPPVQTGAETVGASLKPSLFPSPRLFAGRGRVRGLGEWPRLFNYAPILQTTMCFGRTVVRFKQSGYSPGPSPRLSPQRGGVRGISHVFDRRAHQGANSVSAGRWTRRPGTPI